MQDNHLTFHFQNISYSKIYHREIWMSIWLKLKSNSLSLGESDTSRAGRALQSLRIDFCSTALPTTAETLLSSSGFCSAWRFAAARRLLLKRHLRLAFGVLANCVEEGEQSSCSVRCRDEPSASSMPNETRVGPVDLLVHLRMGYLSCPLQTHIDQGQLVARRILISGCGNIANKPPRRSTSTLNITSYASSVTKCAHLSSERGRLSRKFMAGQGKLQCKRMSWSGERACWQLRMGR